MSWISPNLSDGFGNKLFQLAASMEASKKYNIPLVFFLPRCYKSSHSPIDIFFTLFPDIPIIDSGYNSWYEIEEKSFATFESLPELREIRSINHTGKDHTDNDPTGNDPINIVLKGFRQSEKYFPSESISNEGVFCDFHTICVKVLGLTKSKLISDFIGDKQENTAFLHIRLGDYRFLPHHTLHLEPYWIETLSRFKEEGIVRKIILFSDEPNFVQDKMLSFFKQFNIECKVCMETDPISSLYAMSLCGGGAICANSTFSWWGAYLSKAKKDGRPIYFPSKWGDFKESYEDLYPLWGTKIEVLN